MYICSVCVLQPVCFVHNGSHFYNKTSSSCYLSSKLLNKFNENDEFCIHLNENGKFQPNSECQNVCFYQSLNAYEMRSHCNRRSSTGAKKKSCFEYMLLLHKETNLFKINRNWLCFIFIVSEIRVQSNKNVIIRRKIFKNVHFLRFVEKWTKIETVVWQTANE